jgi:hypothetical protein
MTQGHKAIFNRFAARRPLVPKAGSWHNERWKTTALTGGAGADIFFYTGLSESGITAATRDLVADFEPGSDKIDLSVNAENFGGEVAAPHPITSSARASSVGGISSVTNSRRFFIRSPRRRAAEMIRES